MMNEELKIYDIKGLVEIPDNSFVFFIIACLLGFFVFISLIFLLIRFFKNKKTNQRKIYYENLKNLDFSHSKKASYEATKYLRLLARTPREKNFILPLIEGLEQYKYKKEVKTFDDDLKAKIETFMDMVDV